MLLLNYMSLSRHVANYPPIPCPPWIVPLWTKHRCSQSPVGWLQFFCVRGWSLRHRWRAVCTARLQVVVYCVTHGELSHSCLCPVDKGIYSCFSCLAIFVVCHNSDVLSLLKSLIHIQMVISTKMIAQLKKAKPNIQA